MSYRIEKSEGRIRATIEDVRAPGDTVTLTRTGGDVSATYLPPPNLTGDLPRTPELLPLHEVRQLIERYPEIAYQNGFAIAIEVRLDAEDELFALLGDLRGEDGRLDARRAAALSDRARALGHYD